MIIIIMIIIIIIIIIMIISIIMIIIIYIIIIIVIIYIIWSPPFNPGIFWGGKARNFWEIFHLTTWNIHPPPTCFLGFQKMWGGGPPDATF